MPPIQNKPSELLTSEENQILFQALGSKCKTMATTVVQLYVTQPPMHSAWIRRETGVLCFIKDNIKKNYFFRLYCFKKNDFIWEHGIYYNMEYNEMCPYLHSFEGDKNIIGFNFASEEEAYTFKVTVTKMLNKKKRDMITDPNYVNNPPLINKSATLKPNHTSDPAVKRAKRRRNLTKADIGQPSEFRHVSHIGWDPNSGFNVDTEDKKMLEFLNKAGVSKKQLEDRATREFIYDFILQNGGRDAVEENIRAENAVPPPTQSGPPVPPRSTLKSSHSRVAPPPPAQPPRPPPSIPRTSVSVPVASSYVPPPPPMQPLNGNTAPAPPPLPPVPPPIPPLDLSNANGDYNENKGSSMDVDPRSTLLSSIREGTTLRPVDQNEKQQEDGDRNDLFNDIRKGITLKPVGEREMKPQVIGGNEVTGGGVDLADALKKALAGRKKALYKSDSETVSSTDSDDDDNDWD